MVVTNTLHETSIVIRRDGLTTVFVKFAAGKLACQRLTETQFREQWQETSYPLNETLRRFLEHAVTHGATLEAIKGLQNLQARDTSVIANRF